MKLRQPTLSNRTKIILTVIALLLSIVGTTYAWWTASRSITQEIKLGELNITADFEEIDSTVLHEPGTTVEFAGKIDNTGSVPAMMKLDNTSDHGAVEVSMEPASGSYEENGTEFIGWFKDSNNQKFVLLDPGASLNIKVLATLDGNSSVKIAPNSTVTINVQAKATQVIEGALKKELGLNISDLESIEDGQTRSVSRNMAYLQQLLAR